MGRFMNDELKSILTEMVVAYLSKCPGTCTEGLKKTTTAADWIASVPAYFRDGLRLRVYIITAALISSVTN